MKKIEVSLRNHAGKVFVLFLAAFISCQKENNRTIPPVLNSEYGTLYSVAVNEGLGAIDLKNDAVAWITNAYVADNNSMVYENNVLYTNNLYGVTATNASTGSTIWSTPLLTTLYSQSGTQNLSRPVIKDSLLFLVSFFWVGEDAALRCLNKETGALRWTVRLTGGGRIPGREYSTPVVIGDKVIVIAKMANEIPPTRVFCFDKFSGAQIWRKDFHENWMNNPIPLDASSVLLQLLPGSLYKLDANTGTTNFLFSTLPAGKLLTSVDPLLRDNQLHIATNYGVQVIDPANWRLKGLIKDSLVAYSANSKTFYYQKPSGAIEAWDRSTQKRKWIWLSPLVKYAVTNNPISLLYTTRASVLCDEETLYYYEYGLLSGENRSSVFVLDAENGSLIKEIKLKIGSDPLVLGVNLMVVKDKKAIHTLYNTYWMHWEP